MIKTSILAACLLLLSGCFLNNQNNDLIINTLNAESGDEVEVYAREGGKKYRWKQLSGVSVVIANKRSSTLKFTAPTVTEKTDLVFKLSAKFDDPIHDQITISVYPILIINGIRLPPEPNPEENNATLLGVDSNDNGVRDDVERWVYQTYQDKHPVHIEIGMQSARTWEKIFTDPSNPETTIQVSAAIACESYYKIYAKYYNEPILVFELTSIDGQITRKITNTPERKDAYIAYDKALSGGVYTLTKTENMKSKCEFDTSLVTRAQQ